MGSKLLASPFVGNRSKSELDSSHLPTTLEHAASLERLKIGRCQRIEA